jgi:hypothetical protein
LVANFGGAGDWRVTNLRAPAADPSAFERALKATLADTDPLAEGKVEAVFGTELGRAPLTAASVTTNAAIVGGALRLSPFIVEAGPATWQGSIGYDLKTLSLDTRGMLSAKAAPPDWTGALPSVGLNWRGSLAAPVRDIDAGPFRNGLAAIVLRRELEKIEAFERAAAERQRQIQAQQEAERRKARAAAEEAARQAKQREEAEKARIDAERLQSQQQNDRSGNGVTPFTMQPPIDIRPPAQVQGSPGG